jgi:hypothetical protein
MIQHLQEDTRHWLAPIAPELLVAVPPSGLPTIVEVAPQVAAWAGYAVDDLVGCPLSESFDRLIPGLTEVVEEVSRSGMPVRDYRLTFVDHAGKARTILLQASLKPGRPEEWQSRPAGERPGGAHLSWHGEPLTTPAESVSQDRNIRANGRARAHYG